MDNADLSPLKRQKKVESLQELVHVRPDLKGKPVYFFPALDKYYEGVLMYDVKIKKAYVYSVKVQEKVLPEGEFARTAIQKIGEGLEFHFFKEEQLEKKLLILTKSGLYSNNKDHIPFALLERRGQSDKAYRRIDYKNFGWDKFHKSDACIKRNSYKKVNQQQKIIKEQNETIIDLKDRLQEKIGKEEKQVSDKIADIVHTVARDVTSKNVDISAFHPIFQELIRIQSGKPNGTRYHPMFIRWAISVYSRSDHAAYDAMKVIIRLPSISTLKSYINECEQRSGWQDNIACQMLASLTANKIWSYRRMGFFSHDSFKVQKGLLWNQCKNCYVGYLDFENEMQDY
ncbi:uncharacterized protein OCT59_014960 [Rhizophagus irregularis]|uniref:uncharacterized protein n=1 Tax=Rhizophagus irregularis TaxID=588596 RepID=UPI0033322122|nr:hypothetical protein OCT59_014960 [Rhizophagus irregularis]